MNYKQIVKNGMLMNKITEYFQSNPQKSSVIIKANPGGNSKLFWRAIRESDNKFYVTEVNTSTESFVFEGKLREISAPFSDLSKIFVDALASPPEQSSLANALRVMNAKTAQIKDPGEKQRADNMMANLSALASATRAVSKTRVPSAGIGMGQGKMESTLYESSPQFGQASTLFAQVMAPPFDHNKLSAALQKINSMIGQVTDPTERQNLGTMMGVLTNLVDSTTKGAGRMTVQNPEKQTGGKFITGAPPKANLTQGYNRSGTRLRESTEFSQASKEFLAAMTPPFDHAKIATSWKKIKSYGKNIVDPQEKQQFEMMTGELARMADQTNKNWRVKNMGPELPAPSSLRTTPPPLPSRQQNSGLGRFGKRLGEAEKKKAMTIRMMMS